MINWLEIKFDSADFNTDRKSEVRWVIERLNGGGRLLDVGCLDSKFAELMLPYYDEVYGIDIRTEDDRGKSEPKPYKLIFDDIITCNFKDNFFDEITFISTIEHIGLDTYDNEVIDINADKKALQACYRILKPAGRILITVPYSEETDGRYTDSGVMWERNYSKMSLNCIIDKELFELDVKDFIGRNVHFILLKR